MSDSNAVSSHGFVLKWNGAEVAELKDVTPPPLTRKETDVSIHNSDDDQYVVGFRRKGQLQVMVNWLPAVETSHDALLDAYVSGDKGKIELTDAAGWDMVVSGFVVGIAPKDPVEGGIDATITFRPTGRVVFTP